MSEHRAIGLQSIYRAGRKEALGALAEDCKAIAAHIVRTECRSHGLHFTVERIEELAHEASARFIEQYLKHPGYEVRNFGCRIRYDVRHVMYDRERKKQKSFEAHQELMGETEKYPTQDREPQRFSPASALDELVADHPRGKKIAADLYRTRNYRLAVKRIAVYVERRWIYEHAEALHQIFATFHWRPPRAPGGVPGTGPAELRSALLRGKSQEHVESGKRSHEVAER